MGELIYTVSPKDQIEIIGSLWIFLLLFLIFIFLYKIEKSFLQKELNINSKFFFGIVFMLIILFTFVEYYTLLKVSNKARIALVDNKKCKYIEGIVKKYHNNYGQNKELFVIDKTYFRLEGNYGMFSKNYAELIRNKSLKLKIEYIEFPRNNTTIVRIWKL